MSHWLRSCSLVITAALWSGALVRCGGTVASEVTVETIASDLGDFQIHVSSDPDPAIRGVNRIRYLINDPSGAPKDGLTVTVVPWMPSHGHGTSVKAVVRPLGSGLYEIDDVLFYMPGTWELRTTFEPAGDHAAPSFEIE
jgi:hypothetical protein